MQSSGETLFSLFKKKYPLSVARLLPAFFFFLSCLSLLHCIVLMEMVGFYCSVPEVGDAAFLLHLRDYTV